MAKVRIRTSKSATFWRYSEPKRYLESCSTGYDSHSLGIENISILAYWRHTGIVIYPLTIADIESVSVKIIQTVGEREIVRVKAPTIVWDKLKVVLKGEAK